MKHDLQQTKEHGTSAIDDLLTVEELAAALRLNRSWIYARVHSDSLPFPYTKVGHYLRFSAAGVRDFLAAATRR